MLLNNTVFEYCYTDCVSYFYHSIYHCCCLHRTDYTSTMWLLDDSENKETLYTFGADFMLTW